MGKAIKGKKSDVEIEIRGKQIFPDGSSDSINYQTAGVLFIHPQGFHLSYEEGKEEGMSGVKTLISAEENKIKLIRWGEADLKQEFEKDRICSSLYITKQGNLQMSILTKDMEHSLTAGGGHIRLEYDLFIEEEPVSHNTLIVRIVMKEAPYERI